MNRAGRWLMLLILVGALGTGARVGAVEEEAVPEDTGSEGAAAVSLFGRPSRRIVPGNVAIIYRMGERRLEELRRDRSVAELEIARRLEGFLLVQLAKAADVSGGDIRLLTRAERRFARAMARDLLLGKPAPRLRELDSRFSADTLETLLLELRVESHRLADEALVPGTEEHARALFAFAERRGRELAGISGPFTEDERGELQNLVDLAQVPETFRVPESERSPEPGGPPERPEPLRRDLVFAFLRELRNRILPILPASSPQEERNRLIQFARDNHQILGLSADDAELMAEEFLAAEPSTIPMVPTAVAPGGVVWVSPVVLVPPTQVRVGSVFRRTRLSGRGAGTANLAAATPMIWVSNVELPPQFLGTQRSRIGRRGRLSEAFGRER